MNYLYGVRGFIKKGDGVFELRYVKGDTIRLFKTMYYADNVLCLQRKYIKLKVALEFDARLNLNKNS